MHAETPATAWASAGVPCERLAREPLPELERRVTLLRSAPRPTAAAVAPASDGLTDLERSHAESMTPAQRAKYIELRARNRT